LAKVSKKGEKKRKKKGGLKRLRGWFRKENK